MIIHDNGKEREATDAEIAYYNAWKLELETKSGEEAATQAAREVARQEVLDRLGLSAAEVQLLLGA